MIVYMYILIGRISAGCPSGLCYRFGSQRIGCVSSPSLWQTMCSQTWEFDTMRFTELLFHKLWLAVFDIIFDVGINVACYTIECISVLSVILFDNPARFLDSVRVFRPVET